MAVYNFNFEDLWSGDLDFYFGPVPEGPSSLKSVASILRESIKVIGGVSLGNVKNIGVE